MDQKKIGILLSYFNTVLNMGISIFLTPFLIHSLGQGEYGLYKIVQSFAGELSILTFGMSALVARNVIFFNEKKMRKEKENFLAMSLIVSCGLAFLVALIGCLMYMYTDRIFAKSMTSEEIETAKILVILFITNICVLVLKDGFTGLYKANEHFILFKGLGTVREIIRVILLVTLLHIGYKSIAIISVDLGLSLFLFLADVLYAKSYLKERAKFYYWDKKLLKESAIFSSAVFLQAIITQVNQSLDNFILGVMTTTSIVAVYSVSLTLYTTYNQLAMTISSMYQPSTMKMIAHGCDNETINSTLARISRYELILMGAILVGFVCLGKEFLILWLGEDYLDVYDISIIIFIPATLYLLLEPCQAVLYAKLKNMTRSLILGAVAILHIIISIVLIKLFGFIGAAFGTSLSTITGIILLSIYYEKKLNIGVRNIFIKNIRMLPTILISLIIALLIHLIETPISWAFFCVKIFAFTFLYVVLTFLFSLNKDERNLIISRVRK